ncbi:MAG: hypothetical protein M1376_12165 [Planctomycetes bacterium]|nr:hypothetical protein [Planctomycetota bacterium]
MKGAFVGLDRPLQGWTGDAVGLQLLSNVCDCGGKFGRVVALHSIDGRVYDLLHQVHGDIDDNPLLGGQKLLGESGPLFGQRSDRVFLGQRGSVQFHLLSELALGSDDKRGGHCLGCSCRRGEGRRVGFAQQDRGRPSPGLCGQKQALANIGVFLLADEQVDSREPHGSHGSMAHGSWWLMGSHLELAIIG